MGWDGQGCGIPHDCDGRCEWPDVTPKVTWEIVPGNLTICKRFVREVHRHSEPPTGWLFGFGLAVDHELVGVCVIGHPQSQKIQAAEPRTVEILRVAVVEGTKNANSRMYGNACQMSKCGGYLSAITYTLPHESGASLRAAGFHCESETAGGRAGQTWNVASRPRYEENLFGERRIPDGPKLRWRRNFS